VYPNPNPKRGKGSVWITRMGKALEDFVRVKETSCLAELGERKF